jgi:hypothetical protein
MITWQSKLALTRPMVACLMLFEEWDHYIRALKNNLACIEYKNTQFQN